MKEKNKRKKKKKKAIYINVLFRPNKMKQELAVDARKAMRSKHKRWLNA